MTNLSKLILKERAKPKPKQQQQNSAQNTTNTPNSYNFDNFIYDNDLIETLQFSKNNISTLWGT